MTSLEAVVNGAGVIIAAETDMMSEFIRPTLCVIDENGVEISEDSEFFCGSKVNISRDAFTIRDYNDNITEVKKTNHFKKVISTNKDLDLNELKAMATRLKLSTRRQSTVAWQKEHLDVSKDQLIPKSNPDKFHYYNDDTLTKEKKQGITKALSWLRSELMKMRSEDETLARTLLTIRQDIHQLKLQRSCEKHKEMLDDVTMDMEENYTLHGISDMPLTDSVHDTPLLHLGVTRMNLSARRFSTC